MCMAKKGGLVDKPLFFYTTQGVVFTANAVGRKTLFCFCVSEHSSADGFSLTRVEIVSLKMFFSAPFGGCALAVC